MKYDGEIPWWAKDAKDPNSKWYRQKDGTSRDKVDFYAALDLANLRGVKTEEMVDGDGEQNICVCIPLTKNGIPMYGRRRLKLCIAALPRVKKGARTHDLVLHVETPVIRSMCEKGYDTRYKYMNPIFGYITRDIYRSYNRPIYAKKSFCHKLAEKNHTDMAPDDRELTIRISDGRTFVVHDRERDNRMTDMQMKWRNDILNNRKE